MLDSIIAMGGTSTHDLLNKTVDLQPHNDNDYMRFQTEMKNNDDLKVDNSILEVRNTDENTVEQLNKRNVALEAFQDIDSSYHRVIKGMNDMPSMRDYLQKQGIGGSESIRTNTDGMNANETMAQQTERLLRESQATQNATMDYHTDMSKWGISTQMFMAKVKILTTVVSQAGQGLKTLFRSSG